jgi:hypothetical protein
MKRKSSLRFGIAFILFAALLVGTLDIALAILHFYIKTGRPPVLVLQYIASAVYGSQAYSETWPYAGTGMALHYAIAFIFTVLFFAVYRPLRLYRIHWLLTGILFGLFTWLVMNLLVLPLTQVPHSSFRIYPALLNAGILILAIGWPLAFLTYRGFHKSVDSANLSSV